MSSKARFPAASSAPTAFSCNDCWSIPTKTNSGWTAVLRPSWREKSAKLRSPYQTADRNGAVGKKCANNNTAVQNAAISASKINRWRRSQCTGGLYQKSVTTLNRYVVESEKTDERRSNQTQNPNLKYQGNSKLQYPIYKTIRWNLANGVSLFLVVGILSFPGGLGLGFGILKSQLSFNWRSLTSPPRR